MASASSTQVLVQRATAAEGQGNFAEARELYIQAVEMLLQQLRTSDNPAQHASMMSRANVLLHHAESLPTGVCGCVGLLWLCYSHQILVFFTLHICIQSRLRHRHHPRPHPPHPTLWTSNSRVSRCSRYIVCVQGMCTQHVVYVHVNIGK